MKWRKSSYSNSAGGSCVEVAARDAEWMGVRDSKDRSGPTLTFSADDWTKFLDGIAKR